MHFMVEKRPNKKYYILNRFQLISLLDEECMAAMTVNDMKWFGNGFSLGQTVEDSLDRSLYA